MSVGEGLRGSVQIVEPSAAERAVARRAAESRATVPDVEFATQVDIGAALALARARSASLLAVLVRAAALALREHPRANGAYRDGRFALYSRVNAGVVLAGAPQRFEIATVLDADRKSVEQLAAELDDLTAREGALRQPERAGATFTVAHYPVGRPSALIAPSTAVALAAGEVHEVLGLREGAVVPRQVVWLTLASDHRIVYGAQAVRLLNRIRELLERAAL